MFLFCALLPVGLSCHRSNGSVVSVEAVSLVSSNGVRLAATYYAGPQPNGPGLVLVHMLGSHRGAWEGFARRAQRAGYACIAFDMRGHGESAATTGSYKGFSTEDWLKAADDIDAAVKLLIQKGARPAALGLVGASLGANLVLHYAADHEQVAGVVLVSPGLDYKGIQTKDAISRYGKRPALLMTSQGDSYSAASCRTLKAAASGLCELREYQGAANGTDLLDASATATEEVVLWLSQILPVS